MDNNDIFVPVQPLLYWTDLAVPTVFGDSISYLEVLGKTNYKLNEVIGSLNAVPAMVDKKIEEAFDQSGIEEKIREILAMNTIDVKNPPAGLTPAKGDNLTDDTAAFQNILNYAKNTYDTSCVHVPSGTYLISSLTIPAGVSLVGENMYSTVIKAKDYSNQVLVRATLDNAVIGNIHFNANSKNNASFPNILEITGANSNRLENVIINNADISQVGIEYTTTGATEIIDCIVYRAKTQLLEDTGGVYAVKGLIIAYAGEGLYIKQDNTQVDDLVCYVCVKDLIINAENVSVRYKGQGLVDNSSETNCIDNYNKSANLYYENYTTNVITRVAKALNVQEEITGTKTEEIGEKTVTVTGESSETSQSKHEIVVNNKDGDYGSRTEQVHGQDKLVSGDRIRIADNVSIQAKDVTTTVGAVKAVLASGAKITVNGDVGVDTRDIAVTAQGVTARADSISATAQVVKFSGNSVIIDSTEPMTYKAASKLNDNYNYIPLKAPNGDIVQVLVYNGSDPTPSPEPTETPIYVNVKDLGAVGDGVTDDTEAFNNAGLRNGYIFVPYGTYKVADVSISTGIKGILGEMSTIVSDQASGDMLLCAGDVSLNSIVIQAVNAENAINCMGRLMVSQCYIQGNIAGEIVMSNTQVNNASIIKCVKNSDISNCVLNANIQLTKAKDYTITGCRINGSFVLNGVSETDKVKSLTITGNVFSAATSISDKYVGSLRISGNVNMDDYPEIVVPEPTPPWDYNVKLPDQINFLDATGAKQGAIKTVTNGISVEGTVNAPSGVNVSDILQSPNIVGSKGKIFLNGNNPISVDIFNGSDWINIGYVESSGLLNLIYGTLINTYIDCANGARINFNDSTGTTRYRFICQNDNTFVLQTKVGSNYVDCILINTDGSINIKHSSNLLANLLVQHGNSLVLQNDTSIRFIDKTGTYQNFEVYSSPADELVVRYKTASTSTWQYCIHVDNAGVAHFNKNIDAPNIGGGSGLTYWKNQFIGRVNLSASTASQSNVMQLNLTQIPSDAQLLYFVVDIQNTTALNNNPLVAYQFGCNLGGSAEVLLNFSVRPFYFYPMLLDVMRTGGNIWYVCFSTDTNYPGGTQTVNVKVYYQ